MSAGKLEVWGFDLPVPFQLSSGCVYCVQNLTEICSVLVACLGGVGRSTVIKTL